MRQGREATIIMYSLRIVRMVSEDIESEDYNITSEFGLLRVGGGEDRELK